MMKRNRQHTVQNATTVAGTAPATSKRNIDVGGARPFPVSLGITLASMPSNRAVNFTRGQSVRRLLLGLFLLISTLLDLQRTHDPRESVWLAAGVAAFLGGVISFTPNVLESPENGAFSRTFRIISGLLLLTAFVLGAGYELSQPGFWEAIQKTYGRLSVHFGPLLTLASTAALASIGYGFFVLKTKKLIVYAWLEIAFALTSCFVAVSRAQHELTIGTLTVMGAAVYLTVRGLDNRRLALALGPKTRFARNTLGD